ncbi:MAG: hypothetical protein B6I38_04315 [Anaerolineaceae bacterium 4572_5.1]|nr:MAG: hypothetical protein B6I38_04315 [Anaerolineaceae bacterium 4572_5.1]
MKEVFTPHSSLIFRESFMPPLHILLLGQPETLFEQTPFNIPDHLHKLILYYLASRGCLIPQEELESVFGDAAGRGSEAVAKINDNSPNGELITTKGDLVGLNFEHTYIDHLHFRDLIDEAGRVPWQISRDQPLPLQIVKLLNQALDLWRGDSFLEGVDFSDLPQAKQEVQKTARGLLKLRESVLERLADHYYIEGDFQAVENVLLLAMKSNNISDHLYQLRMKTYINQGQLEQACEYYEKVSQEMVSRGRIAPPPGLTALYQEVKGDTHVDIPEPRPTLDIHPCVDVPLVGRESILSKLVLARKQHQSVLLCGEAGQGKTRILKEYADSVSDWYIVLKVSCKPNEVNLPYQPFISLFRHQIFPNTWLELSPVWASSLAYIFPEITMMRSDADDEAAELQGQSVLMEAIRQTFKQLASDKPILLVFDDLQYADADTIQTFTYLLERYPFKNGRGMLVGAFREDKLTGRYPEFMNVLRGSKYVNLIKVLGLSPKAISKITYHVLQESPSNHFVRTLAEESGGNPLFILEMLWSILDTGRKPNFASQAQFPLNEKLSNLIGNRLAALDEITYRVLETAAVLGTDFELDLLTLITKIDEEEIAQAIEKLLRDNLIVEFEGDEDARLHYRFVHKKFREVLLQRMSSARRIILHNRAAYIKLDEGVEPAIIAAHFEEAKEYNPAFYYWGRAGEEARRLASTAEATYAFQQAENLMIEHKLVPSSAHLYRFFSAWSAIAFETQDIELVERLNKFLLETGEKRGDNLIIGAAWGNLSDACLASGQFAKGLEYSNRSLGALDEKQHTVEYMENLVRKGVFLYMLNHFDKAEEIFQDALALGLECEESLEIFNALANAHYQMALATTLNLRPRTGLKHAELCLEYAQKGHHPHRQLTGYNLIAFSQYFLGNYKQGRAATKHGFELAERVQGWRTRGYLHSYQAMIDLAEGDIESALGHAEETVQIGRRFAYHDNIAIGKRVKGDIYRLLQAYEAAQKNYSAGRESAPEHFTGFDNIYRLGLTLVQAGEIKQGLELIRQGVEKMEAAFIGTGVVWSLFTWEAAAILANNLEQAKDLNTKIHKLSNGSGCRSMALSNQIMLGEIIFQEGNIAQAEEHFQSVAQEAADLANPWIELEAQLSWEKTLKATGQETSECEERITHLLDKIQTGLTNEDILPYYKAFRQKVLDREVDPILYI